MRQERQAWLKVVMMVATLPARVQGAAQMLTLFASAIGSVVFARCHALFGSYAPALWILAPLVFSLAFIALRVPMPRREDSCGVPALGVSG